MNRSKLAAILAFALAATPALAAEEAGVFKIPGTETTLKLNGYIQLDTTYDFDGAIEDIRGTDWASFIETLPLDDDPDQQDQPNRLYMTARTSRIGLTTNTPTKAGALTVRLEGDFNHPAAFNFSTEPTTNGMDFRLRHAYGELAGFLVGQTWTNFLDLGSLTDTVEFNGHGAFGAVRVPMIRYAAPVGAGSLSVSLENPQSLVAGTDVSESFTVGRRYDRMPAVTASLTFPFKYGHVNLRGVAHEYQGQIAAAGVEDEAFGWGVGASGSLKFAAETLVWSVQGGDGIGYYTFQSLLQGAGFVGDEIKTWMSWSYHLGLTHAWSDKVRSNVIWTQTFFDKDDELAAAMNAFFAASLANEQVNAFYVNTFVSPAKNVEIGLEYNWGQRKIFDSQVVAGNDTGTQHRVNALARYSFF